MENVTEKLQKTQKELEELKAEYLEFVYKVSHDLGAPLRTINGFSELLSKKYADKLEGEGSKYLDFIVKGANEGKDILNALLDYSRFISKDISFQEVNLNHVLEEVLLELEEVILKTEAKLKTENLPIVKGVKEHLKLLFFHLIHNALLYQNEGTTPNITLSLQEKSDYFQFCITDNGIGVREKSAKKIFKALERDVSKKDYAGMGMGLSYVNKIVAKYSGEIWLESQVGKGTSFYFTLPKIIVS